MTVHCGQGIWNAGQWFLPPDGRQVVVTTQQGYTSLFISIAGKRWWQKVSFPFRTEEHFDLGWNEDQSHGVWQKKTNPSLVAASSHMPCVPPCSFSPLLMISMITCRRDGSSPHPTGGNFSHAFSRGDAGILTSVGGTGGGVRE